MKSNLKAFAIAFAGALALFHATAQETATPAPKGGTSFQNRLNRVVHAPLFKFDGGHPRDFILLIQDEFKLDLLDIVTIPRELAKVEVPKIRFRTDDPELLFKLYNELAQDDPSLGRWTWDGSFRAGAGAKDGAESSQSGQSNKLAESGLAFLVLVPDKQIMLAKQQQQVRPAMAKVFHLGTIPEADYDLLVETVNKSEDVANQSRRDTDQEFMHGTVIIDRRTRTLIASGSADYMDLVESSIDAFSKNAASAGPKQSH